MNMANGHPASRVKSLYKNTNNQKPVPVDPERLDPAVLEGGMNETFRYEIRSSWLLPWGGACGARAFPGPPSPQPGPLTQAPRESGQPPPPSPLPAGLLGDTS
ncbi:hypothetical protein H1C71_006216 [Ictidomys tridecemlineatus]|nr:hypothetical protein H1C71_006216 [Ictidomys tridecemlineatus]KAG3279180.1 hypothetical protein H1C71_006216 [Ictidomys tridecemlineatus]KAG3279181.1 hypothetical protein H1C71_006216 [Ictidomys tridecemlineatus]KAG3279185.1 hypothetical protein H1C71_006216 [Ictidomys tridecemlineatus]